MPGKIVPDQATLIDAFFHEQDQKLLNQLRARLARQTKKAQLAEIAGITDEAVLDRLVELNIGPETLAAMELVPLICVAWADRKMDPSEKKAILAAADSIGLTAREELRELLDHWLNRRPGRELLDAWKHYITALCTQLSADERQRLESFVLGYAERVAQAAGGFLGLGNKVSPQEQAVLDELHQAFGR